MENELYLALHFDPYAKDGKVHVRNRFLSVRHPKRGTAEGCLSAPRKLSVMWEL